jgi:hypothetical protein
MEAVRTSETSVDNHFTRQYNPEDSSEHHTRRRENLKSHNVALPTFGSQVFLPRQGQCSVLNGNRQVSLLSGTPALDPTKAKHVRIRI